MTGRGPRPEPDRETGIDLMEVLEARAAMTQAVRDYFTREGFLEVSTPALVRHPNLDPNVRPVAVSIHDQAGRHSRRWLHTSPELSMKKLLAGGAGSIYQIGPVFRDSEHSPLYRCEFTMLEWYRLEAGYEDAIRDTIRVVRAASRPISGGDEVTFKGRSYDLAGQWEEVTVAQAFDRYAGVRSLSSDDLSDALEGMGYTVRPDEPVEDLFFHVFVEAVEPFLGLERPTIIRDYPSFLGTMASAKPDDPKTLERFEVYIAGLEMANGYTELTDATQLAHRMEKVMADLTAQGVRDLSIDEDFLEAMAGLPPCAGVSVGMDRLAMLVLDRDDISEVVYPHGEVPA